MDKSRFTPSPDVIYIVFERRKFLGALGEVVPSSVLLDLLMFWMQYSLITCHSFQNVLYVQMGLLFFRNRGWRGFEFDVLSSHCSPTLLKTRHTDTKRTFYLLQRRRDKSIVSFLLFPFHNPMQNDCMFFEQSFWTHLRPGGLHSQASVSVPAARIFFPLPRAAQFKRDGDNLTSYAVWWRIVSFLVTARRAMLCRMKKQGIYTDGRGNLYLPPALIHDKQRTRCVGGLASASLGKRAWCTHLFFTLPRGAQC